MPRKHILQSDAPSSGRGGGNAADFVVEYKQLTSKSGHLEFYRKWKSGLIELWWRSTPIASINFPQVYGSQYYRENTYTVDSLPLFKGFLDASVKSNFSYGSMYCKIVGLNASAANNLKICIFNSANVNLTGMSMRFTMYTTGLWK